MEAEIDRLRRENEWYKKKYGNYFEKCGLHNWRNLFRKPNIYEWTVLILLILTYIAAYAYFLDIKTCREFIKNNTFNLQPQNYSYPIIYNWTEINSSLINAET